MQPTSPLHANHEAFLRREAERTRPRDAAERPGAATGGRAVGELEYLPYGPRDEEGLVRHVLPAMFGEVELEYAAIRRGAGLMDCPNRATIRVSGGDRHEFFRRMLTQDLLDLAPGRAKRTFWLNRQGRIVADLLLVERDDATLIDVDIHQAAAAIETLDAYIIADDVVMEDVTESFYRIEMHGPKAMEVIGKASGEGAGDEASLDDGEATSVTIAGADIDVARADTAGEIGLLFFVPRAKLSAVWEALLAAGDPPADAAAGPRFVRPVGWYAYNIARIEAGTPLFNVDFGPQNLPHETGVLRDRVCFTKGCYLGQEVVARMESLGRPKQRLVGLKIDGEALPIAEAQVFAGDDEGLGTPIGVVTSSTPSPMLGAKPIAFAMIKSAHADDGKAVRVLAEGEAVPATVGPLRFWTGQGGSGSAGHAEGEGPESR